ncbi:MAG: GAF domain-containing protein, partial [Cytophagales bacterium]
PFKGNIDVEYESVDTNTNQDLLAESLLSMRSQMKRLAEQERERNWVTQGLAKFVDILRADNSELSILCEKITSNLVKYLGANQGYLFIVNDNNPNDVHLELMACFAYDRKKFIEKRVEIGEGLLGQSYLEKESVFMTNVPQNYVHITSGLGESTPGCVTIVPLKINEEVFGLIEIASFKPIEKYQIEFLEKLGESIASTVSSVKVSERTSRLLAESRQMTEEMRAQEEEMRQNMEELQATQEEMQRMLKQVQTKESYLSGILDAAKDTILVLDKQFRIINMNKAAEKSKIGGGGKVKLGLNIVDLIDGEQKKEAYTKLLNNTLKGNPAEFNYEEVLPNGETLYYLINLNPMADETGNILSIVLISKEITELVLAQKETEAILDEVKRQNEQIMAQEEEIRQNLEESHAIAEELEKSKKEMEELRKKEAEIAEKQISSIMKDLEQCKVREQELLNKIKQLESKNK